MSNNQDRSKFHDVTSLGLTCKTCTEAIVELPFVPKTKDPLNCMKCHAGRDKSQDPKREKRDRNRNRGPQPQNFTKGEQLEVQFGKQGDRLISCLRDGTPIFPGSLRFKPIAGKKYQCSVQWRQNAYGKYGLAMPAVPGHLTPKEWIPLEELRGCLVVSVTFQKSKRPGTQEERIIAWHEGRAVFPDRDTTVVLGKPMGCLLREAGNVAYAIPTGVEEQTGTGLVRLADQIGQIMDEDFKLVVVLTANKKSTVIGQPKSAADLADPTGEYRPTYELLSDPDGRVVVNESSTEDEINKAYRRVANMMHPDKVALDYGGAEKVPLLVMKNAEYFYNAINTARERALELIDRKKAKREGRDAAQVPNSGQATAPKGDKPSRRERRNQGKGSEQPKASVASVASVASEGVADVVQPAETKPVEGAVETSGTAEVPANVDAPSQEGAEAKPAAEPITSETGSDNKDPEQVEIDEAFSLARKTSQYAGLTMEEFLSEEKVTIRNFYRRQARVALGRAASQAKTAPAVGGSSKKAAKSKGGDGGSKDLRSQLAGINVGKK